LAKLFDHLVGDREYVLRNGKTERLGGLLIDDKIKFGRLLDLVLAPCGVDDPGRYLISKSGSK
jgi:hypothetical protein